MEASYFGHTETMGILIEAKADPNFTNEVKVHYSHCLYNSNLMDGCCRMATPLSILLG